MTYNFCWKNPEQGVLGCGNEPWATPEFLSAVQQIHNLEAGLLLCYKGEEVVASLPLFVRSLWGKQYLVQPVTAYYQPLQFFHVQSHSTRRHLDELRISEALGQYLKSRYHQVGFKLAPQNLDARGFIWSGMKAKPLYTYILEFETKFEPLKDEKKKLELAQLRGYEFSSGFCLDKFMALYSRMNERKEQKSSLSLKKLEHFFHLLHQAGLLQQRNVIYQGETVSADLFMGLGSGTAYMLLRASQAEEMKYGVSTWHTARLIDELMQQYDRVDFCGANVPEVARFKAAMGMHLAVFFQIGFRKSLI